MDYENKYKKALEKARQLCAYPTTKPFISDLQDLFPELKESEDERIRKALIEYFRWVVPQILSGFDNKEVLAWLEKQGEQKSLNDIAKEVIKDKDAAISFLKSCGIMNEDGELADEYKIEQDEQKPTNKVEPKFKVGDKIYLKPEYRMPDDDTPIANTVFEIRAIDDKHYRFDGSYIFIEDQDKYELVEQKPSAWSEEDEIGLWDALWAIQQARTIAKDENDMGNIWYAENWLKSLKGRVQQQPKQEWSEDDKRIIDNLISQLGNLYARKLIKEETKDKYVNLLKSIKERCTWKPSDEQMAALSDINCTGGISYAGQGQELINLYNDLKKLK